MKCILVSRFGANNIGDLAISETTRLRLEEKFKVDIYNFYGSQHLIKDVDNIYKNRELMVKKEKFKRKLKDYKLDKLLSLTSKVKTMLKDKPSVAERKFREIVKDYDICVIAGGNMLMGLGPKSNSIETFKNYVSEAGIAKIPVYVLDIGIGPFYSANQASEAVAALNKCEAITFRDEQSYNLFKKHDGDLTKASISVDPVFLMKNQRERKNSRKVNIGVNIFDASLIGFSKKDYKKTIKSYSNLINKLIDNNGYNVHVFTTTLVDEITQDLVIKNINDKDKLFVSSVNGISELLDLYKNLDLLVGTRMHSLIIAYSQLLPIIGLSWQPKVDAMFEIVQEEDYVFDFYNFNKEIDAILAKISQRLDNREKERVKALNNLAQISKKSKVNDRLLEEFILSNNLHAR